MSQIESGVYNDWFAPLLDLLWSLPYNAGFILIPVLVAQVGALVGGFYLLARLFLPRVQAALTSVIGILSPPIFGLAGFLGRDVWFTGLALLAAGCLARYASSDRRRAAATWLGAFLVFVLLMTAARQNALPLTSALLAGTALIWLVRRRRAPPRPGMRPLVTAAAVGLAGALGLFGALRVGYEALDVRSSQPEQVTLSWDLASLSVRTDRVLLPREIYPTRDLDLLERAFAEEKLRLLFVPLDDPPLRLGPFRPLTDTGYSALRRAWWSAVTSEPLEYLASRGSLWLRHVGLTSAPVRVSHLDVSDNNEGYGYWNRGWFDRANDYHALFTWTGPSTSGAPNRVTHGVPLFSSFLYLVLAVAGGSILAARALRTRRVVWLAPAALLLGAAGYELGLAFALAIPGYRWSYPLVAAVIAVGLPALVGAVRAGRQDRLWGSDAR